MKKNKILMHTFVVIVLLCTGKLVFAEQQPLNAISKKSTGDYVTQIREGVNTELAKQQLMNTELYGLFDSKEPAVYVGATAPADTTKLFLDSDEESGVLIQKKYVTGTGWVRVGSHGVQYATSCVGITGGMCVDTDDGKLYYHNGTEVVEVASGGSGATAINDLTDVDTTGKAEGKLLKFDASGNLVVGTDDTGSGSYPDAGIPNSTGSAWGASYTVDTDLSIVSASDDSIPSAKATKAALDLKADATGISFVAAALSDLKYDPDTETEDDEYALITNTGSVGDDNDSTVVPTLERAGTLFQAADSDLTKDAIVFHFYNDGSALAANQTANTKVPLPWNATITKASVVCEDSGSVVFDVWKDSYANYPPTVADTITASAKPSTSSATKSQDSTLTGWTTSLSAGDILKANIDSNATHTDCTLTLEVTK